jgi:hypothetical protein
MSGIPQYPQQPYPHGYPQGGYPSQPAGNPFADQPVNPYAAPQQTGYYPQQLPPRLSPFAGLWRDGHLLVMHKLAPLPDICVLSNEPATQRLKRKLYWHHPAVYLALLVNLIVYAVVAMILTKKATIQLPLTDAWLAIRRRRMIFAWSLVLISVVLFAVAVPQVDRADWGPFVLIGSVLLGLGAAIYGLVACRLVSPKRMTDDYIWLKGVHPDFLNRLEQWPYHI